VRVYPINRVFGRIWLPPLSRRSADLKGGWHKLERTKTAAAKVAAYRPVLLSAYLVHHPNASPRVAVP
jgi:hypothetical protein